MKIGVIGASGKAGRLIVKEAQKRGHDVTAIVRDKNKVENVNVIEKEIAKLTKEDLIGFDVIVNAFGVVDEKELGLYTTYTKHLCDILSGTPIRYIVVGGAGGLYIDSSHTVRLIDAPNFPEIYKGVANAALQSLHELRKHDKVQWTYLCPPAEFDAEGVRTGSYVVGGDELILNSEGKSYISYADYALALLDEIEKPQHIQKQYTVVSK